MLIRQMSLENPLWARRAFKGSYSSSALRSRIECRQIHGQAARATQPGWRAFLCNPAPDVAAMDLFVVPTLGFDLLYAFVIVRIDRRDLVWINVTPHPTAEWVARQITEAFPWNEAPRRLRAMGIWDKPIAPASPWQKMASPNS